MKRFHVHVAVPDLEAGIRFYSTMFGAQPAVVKPDYAKWMLEDPRVNFAISQREGRRAGVNHLGFQVDSDDELSQVHSRLEAAGGGIVEERAVECCYARSDKYWIKDPAGVAWESFRSLGTVPVYGEDARPAEAAASACGSRKTACCG
jgi:catechol 2,3-dioxygenase-like lactoylglutathione lyase family enzyme